MSHISYEKWVMYVSDDLDEDTRLTYEEHLSICDSCLNLYMMVIESQTDELPNIPDGFTEKIVNHVMKNPVQNKKEHKQSIYQKSFFHYILAASMTLILMFSGLFGQLTQVVSTLEEKTKNVQKQSLTEELMNKTISIIQFTKEK